ncbi:hypothetical protein [Shimia biformata]|uniref:hypothetical protein n=1 Tax=Shimia biformata TaxID=1294299 RepID=UPI0019515CBE|nr:hypothetical protein [Shimia biformata]
MLKHSLAVLSLIVVTAQAAAADGHFKLFGQSEGWNVFTDTEKMTCMIESSDDAGNVVQMGLTQERDVAYVGVFTQAETGIKRDSKEAVAILLGDKLYIGEATGMRGNITKGYSGGYVLSDDPQFVEDIQKQYKMVVFPEKEYSFIVDLSGTYKAIEMARDCTTKAVEGQ